PGGISMVSAGSEPLMEWSSVAMNLKEPHAPKQTEAKEKQRILSIKLLVGWFWSRHPINKQLASDVRRASIPPLSINFPQQKRKTSPTTKRKWQVQARQMMVKSVRQRSC
ncbi:MAG: hypothetical protein Q8P67_06725, partial [archaeon]|nr:hypothetical protein [archaeon]